MRVEKMAERSATFVDFNPTGDRRVTVIKSGVDALIEFIRAETASSGPETQRRASIAITGLEQASMWGVKALFSEDAVKGDDGGSGEPAARVAEGATDGDAA
jgi:hypothetical protein